MNFIPVNKLNTAALLAVAPESVFTPKSVGENTDF